MSVETFLEKVQKAGYRVTRARRWLVEFFNIFDLPISAIDLQIKMEDADIVVNKTTVYRELVFLIEQGLLQSEMLSDGTVVYESKLGHHHHLTCRECSRIVHVDLGALEQELIESESWLSSKGFKSIEHQLEFIGECPTCVARSG